MSDDLAAAPMVPKRTPGTRPQGRRRWTGLALVGALAAASIAMCSTAASGSATRQATTGLAFYLPPSPLPMGPDGALIRHQTISSVLDVAGVLASAQRIMYLSRDAHSRRIAVTGTVLTPTEPWRGSGPRPLIGYAAGTQGVADRARVRPLRRYRNRGSACALAARTCPK